jgi:hypothetical protein
MTVAFAERLTVVGELMGTLELVTRAGQQHVMGRILTILRGEILSLVFPLAEGDLASILEAMAELEHEAGRIAPTAAAFNRHARIITSVLGRPDTSLFSLVSAETSVWPTSASGSIYEGTMDTKPRLTKQGIKDLNHYGPKPGRIVAEAPSPAGDEEVKASPPVSEKKPDATVSAGA